MAQLTLESVKAELVPVGNQLMKEWINKTVDDANFTWPSLVFHQRKTSSWLERFTSATGTELWPEWFENQPTPMLEWEDLEEAEVEPNIFKAGFPVTELFLRYGAGNTDPLSRIISRMEFFTSDFMQKGFLRHPQMAARVFLKAFDSAAQPMRDGTALVANAHTDVPGDNMSTRKLGINLLKEYDDMAIGVDSHDIPRLYNYAILMVGPHNRTVAETLLNSINLPGGSANDVNVFRNRYRLVINPWLNESVQTGASEYSFVLDPNLHNLYGRILEMPHYQPPFQRDSETVLFEARTIFTYFALNNAGIAGSDGSTAA